MFPQMCVSIITHNSLGGSQLKKVNSDELLLEAEEE